MTTTRRCLAQLTLASLVALIWSAAPVLAWQEDPEPVPMEETEPAPTEETELEGDDDDDDSDSDSDSGTCDDCDERENFQVSFFVGSVIDNFAADNLKEYLNPDASGETTSLERLIGGVDFGYRLFGDPETPKEDQFWVYGWTVHGVRSADVNCQESPTIQICRDQLARPEIDDFNEQFLFALRQATSLEAAVGLRWEFLPLQKDSTGTKARLYGVAQLGFLAVEGDDDDVLEDHLFGFGAVATNGVFEGSYLQAGYGPSHVFEVNPDERWKVDALLSWAPADNDDFSFFIEITVDVDSGMGADSVQTYLGFDFNLGSDGSIFGFGGDS